MLLYFILRTLKFYIACVRLYIYLRRAATALLRYCSPLLRLLRYVTSMPLRRICLKISYRAAGRRRPATLTYYADISDFADTLAGRPDFSTA